MSELNLSTVRFVLLDIEGTTTSISFVHDVLFPYSLERIESFVQKNESLPKVQDALSGVKLTMSEESNLNDPTLGDCIEQLKTWIREDRKHTSLKSLQGLIWKEGFETKAYTSHLYSEVSSCLKEWKEKGLELGIYSSGSVGAQKLLFSHTVDGDLTPLLSAFFDTEVGHKREEKSYSNIQGQLNIPAPSILFLSDVPEELEAAQNAGLQTLHVVREGTESKEGFSSISEFSELVF
jgi:enolase-phosphatase E1